MSTSSETTIVLSSCREGYLNPKVLDERKRKRKESNKESARRSRVRKQQHLDDLTAEIARMKIENYKLGQTVSFTSQQFLNVEADNFVLRAQMIELTQMLESLNGIIKDMNTLNGVGSLEDEYGIMKGYFGNVSYNITNNIPWNNFGYYFNQPII